MFQKHVETQSRLNRACQLFGPDAIEWNIYLIVKKNSRFSSNYILL